MNPAPWTRTVVTWALDLRPYRATCPPTRVLSLLLLEHPVWLLLTTLPDDDRADLAELICEHHSPVTDDLMRTVVDELIHAWTGWPGSTATRLWREALESWQATDGHNLTHGVDLLDLPPDRATTAVFATLAERHGNDKDHGDRWRRTLQTQPLDVTRREARKADSGSDAQDWQAMATIFGGIQK